MEAFQQWMVGEVENGVRKKCILVVAMFASHRMDMKLIGESLGS